jgi:hypothetical protein
VRNPCAVKVDIFWKKTNTEAFHMIKEAVSKESYVLPSVKQDIIYPPAMRYWWILLQLQFEKTDGWLNFTAHFQFQ